jgi:L-aspartate oxidase
MTQPTRLDTDVLVLGSGIAGLSAALELADFGHVTVVTKRDPEEANTLYAQGGISTVLGDDDSFESHVRDTLVAGAGLCREDIVRICVEEGPGAIGRMVNWGVRFDRDLSGRFNLGLEGGHTHRRILHAGDITGREIERGLHAACKAHPNVQLLGDHHTIDLITTHKHLRMGGARRCVGAYVLDVAGDRVVTVRARHVVLATGGAGKVYRYTTTPDVATGDGVAMAWRAGARVANLEFFQFHPTCLYHPNSRGFLISEALRGEGGVLALLSNALNQVRDRPVLSWLVAVLGIFAASLFYGDAVITPAISVLSAVEGITLAAPGMAQGRVVVGRC